MVHTAPYIEKNANTIIIILRIKRTHSSNNKSL